MPQNAKPKCKKGTACGDSCIAKDLNCIDEISESSRQIALRLISSLENTAADKRMSSAEADAIAENAEFLYKATPREIIDRAFAMGKAELGDDYTDDPAIVDAVWEKLDSSTKLKLKTKGKVAKDDHWNPDEKSGNGPASDTRGKYMLEMYIKQNGKDAYTGLPIDLLASDLEHIVPYSVGGKKSENPDNFVLVSRSVNQNRGNAPLAEWVKRVSEKPKSDTEKPPKIDKNALDDALAATPKDKWTDEDIDKFSSSFFYVSKHLGLKNTYSYAMASGRSASDRPPASWGKPIVKLMAKALRTGDAELSARVVEANNSLLEIMTKKKTGKLDSVKADKAINRIMTKLK